MTTKPTDPAFRLRLGTRRSALALAQSGMMARALEEKHPGLAVELVPIVTTGDVVTGDLALHGGKGLFTQELETGLLDGSLDLAVHSLKDLPVTLPAGLKVAAYPERADPRDVLVSEAGESLDDLPEGAVVLTGALRRRAQILMRRPDLRVEPLRGNVDTRLRKWRESGAGGVILAGAGLDRLGLRGLPAHPIPPDVLIPAPGQGTLALEVRAGGPAEALTRALDHAASGQAALAERRVVAAFGGNCTLPLAAWARPDGRQDGALRLTALLATPDGRHSARGEAVGNDPLEVADACVAVLRENGADDVLARLRG
ncbi:MAG TPA: hydroxymethylbilane synthase [Thermoanaerobaculia bacterium]|jgi:hydroxymethylbilane synthase|nr:hydroxymethylbilane synthase [Thermoanaerobaculia bacterium]